MHVTTLEVATDRDGGVHDGRRDQPNMLASEIGAAEFEGGSGRANIGSGCSCPLRLRCSSLIQSNSDKGEVI